MISRKERGWSSCEKTLPILLNLPKMENRPPSLCPVEGQGRQGATSVSSGKEVICCGGVLRKMDGEEPWGANYLIGLMI